MSTVVQNKTYKVLDFACTSRNTLRRPPSVYLGVHHYFYLRNLNSSIIWMIYLNNNGAIEVSRTLWLTICYTLIAHFLDALESKLLPCPDGQNRTLWPDHHNIIFELPLGLYARSNMTQIRGQDHEISPKQWTWSPLVGENCSYLPPILKLRVNIEGRRVSSNFCVWLFILIPWLFVTTTISATVVEHDTQTLYLLCAIFCLSAIRSSVRLSIA